MSADMRSISPPLPRGGELVWPLPAMRVRRRSLVASVLLAVLAVVGAIIELASGAYFISPSDVAATLLGGGSPIEHTTILDWRMPRVLVALGVGVALGGAGALTQSLARNPLASPDLLGIAMGSSAAAVAMIVLAPSGVVILGVTVGVLWAAFAGGILVAIVVAVLAYRDGLEPMRLVLIGVGINAVAVSVVSMLQTRSSLGQAAEATVWLAGSLEARAWEQVVPLWITLGVAVVMVAIAAFDFRVTHLGEAVSLGLGARVRLNVALMWIASVIATAAAVAAAGPISFVALAAPQLARFVYRTPHPPIIGGAILGAIVVLYADLVARYVLSGISVGVVTSVLGAPFLLYVLVRVNRKVTL